MIERSKGNIKQSISRRLQNYVQCSVRVGAYSQQIGTKSQEITRVDRHIIWAGWLATTDQTLADRLEQLSPSVKIARRRSVAAACETTFARAPNAAFGTASNNGRTEMKKLLMMTSAVFLCTAAHADMLFTIPLGVSEGHMNVRTGPGANHGLIGAIPGGQTVSASRCVPRDDGIRGAEWCFVTWPYFNHHCIRILQCSSTKILKTCQRVK